MQVFYAESWYHQAYHSVDSRRRKGNLMLTLMHDNQVLKEYEQIIYIPMSSGLSGSCQSAYMIAQEEYEGKVFVIDNQRISVTQRQSALDAKEMAEAGLPEPVFQNHRNEFVVILYNDQEAHQTATTSEKKKDNNDLLAFCAIPRTRKEITEYLGISTVFYAMQHYVQPLLASGDLIMTMPEKPKSRNQRFVSRSKE